MGDVLPSISHLQFAVLDTLSRSTLSGKAIRDELACLGKMYQPAAFSGLMVRLVRDGFVRSEVDNSASSRHGLPEKCYFITDAGISAWKITLEFYAVRQQIAETLQ